MSKYLNPVYKDLESYTPGEQLNDKNYIKLNTNESPFPPSCEVINSLRSDNIAKLNLYPDPECTELKEKIAKLYGFLPENVFLSNGSDDILNFCFIAFCTKERKVAFPDISYGFYEVFANFNNLEAEQIPLKENFILDYRDYCNKNKLIIIANPNAPTGIAITPKEVEKILCSNTDNVVVIDEAYVDFGADSCTSLVNKYDNLLVVQTFSKSRSMAGARLGFAFGSKGLIQDLNKIKYSVNPYSVNRMTMAAGIAAIESNDYYLKNCKEIIKVRDYTSNELVKLGFEVTNSKANFVFAKTDCISGKDLYLELKEKGVLVRYFDKDKIQSYNRITIGTKKQMDIFIQTVKKILEEVQA